MILSDDPLSYNSFQNNSTMGDTAQHIPQTPNIAPPMHSPPPPPTTQSRQEYADSSPQKPSMLAGLHNSPMRPPPGNPPPPPTTIIPTLMHEPYTPHIKSVTVNDPQLTNNHGLFSIGPPHWTYCVTTLLTDQGRQLTFTLRRRYSHFEALENRLRSLLPGAILPAKPEKHATRALEDGSLTQSHSFAISRAHELQLYLQKLIMHPLVGPSQPLKIFLTLYDDIGTFWPEVSSSALTKLTAVTSKKAAKLKENTTNAMLVTTSRDPSTMTEDNAD